jgi:uroporphyrinogen-III decarboxylase
MLVDDEQNRESAKTKLELPVLALGGDAFIGARNERIMNQPARNVTGHVFHAGHDLAEEVPQEMAAALLPFLATCQLPA